ncbi:MAG TPA: ABC transporter ATP-binding protein [Polyangiaceae bacterium]|nr:MAG: Macrolide export ATP-binding/permease protein MacB [Deltaproteobacteria bacterium ADurb.Bin207]HNS98190.1 ABC transporter ATP-binding protein [Polyangiaceae bacterium]HNZ22631.1 ABC transporter ATP-binding protein [Polyangiaceae bacterium]HOD21526.1 ABC transporter ATP-binding protein [Polyangiaceae bacterium]HOE48370.1 ABC transporter ATP-binding protein [Polyangiaceae bacterium]
MTDQAKRALIHMLGVTKVYGKGEAEVRALAGIDLRVDEGEMIAIMGQSGSGKSTCMNIVGCLDAPTSGTYLFRNVNVGELDNNQRALLRRHYIGFVFQGFNLLARTSAQENVELPLVYRRVPAAQRREKAKAALQLVGLAGRESHKPNELSGGQQQRVAIARALASDPSLLLADEPTGNLDSARSAEVMELLVQLNRERGITVMVITHEPEMAEFCQRTVEFRDGRILSDTRKPS